LTIAHQVADLAEPNMRGDLDDMEATDFELVIDEEFDAV
jgi:hypothetical protein